MSSLTKENIPHLCRACLRKLENKENGLNVNERKQGPAFYHIDRTNNLHKWMTIINPLEDVTRLKIIEHHKQFPQYVCRSCYENFKHMNDFKEMVVHSFSVFSKLLAIGNEKKTGQPEQPVAQKELIVKSEPINDDDGDNDYNDYDDDDDDDDDNDVFDDDDDYMGNDWEMNNGGIMIEPEVNLMEENAKSDTSKGLKPLAAKSTSSSPPIVDEEVGQPKAIKAYKCSTCKISYVHKYTYVAHIRQVHMGIEHAFECEICHKSYTKFPNLYRHMRSEHNESLRQFKCEYSNCNRSFRQLPTRRKHYDEFHSHEPLPGQVDDSLLKKCLKEKEQKNSSSPGPSSSTTSFSNLVSENQPTLATPVIYQRNSVCTLCFEAFETCYDLKVHMSNDHKKDLKYRCGICGAHKISQIKLDEHIATTHKNKSFCCHICQKILKSKSHLRQHVLTVHNRIKPFPCEHCPAKFATKNTLKVHTRIHTGEKPFKCSICNRRFTQLTPMKKHMITHERGHRNAI